jgi:hypothetical protein
VEQYIHGVDYVPFPYMHGTLRSASAQASPDDESPGGIAAGGITMTSLDPDELEANVGFDSPTYGCQLSIPHCTI